MYVYVCIILVICVGFSVLLSQLLAVHLYEYKALKAIKAYVGRKDENQDKNWIYVHLMMRQIGWILRFVYYYCPSRYLFFCVVVLFIFILLIFIFSSFAFCFFFFISFSVSFQRNYINGVYVCAKCFMLNIFIYLYICIYE